MVGALNYQRRYGFRVHQNRRVQAIGTRINSGVNDNSNVFPHLQGFDLREAMKDFFKDHAAVDLSCVGGDTVICHKLKLKTRP
jgi:hypothetical protein